MPAIAPAPPPQSVPFVWQFPSASGEAIPLAQGVEGQKMYEAAEEARRHWSERAEVLVAELDDADAPSYVSVPPNRVFSVTTRYLHAGKGKPLTFDLDEE